MKTPHIPAKAGTQIHPEVFELILSPISGVIATGVGFTWIPAFAGRSGRGEPYKSFQQRTSDPGQGVAS